MSRNGTHSVSATTISDSALNAGPMKATAAGIAQLSAVRITEPLSISAMRVLKKPYPGHIAVLGRVLDMLPSTGLRVTKIDATALHHNIAERERVAGVEAALAPVARSAAEQRLALDHQLMSALYKVARTVRASEDDELQAEWSFLTDYLSQYGKMAARAKAARRAEAEKKAEVDAAKK